MKVRILGTSINKYLKNLQSVPTNTTELLLRDNGTIFCLYCQKTKKDVLRFESDVTRRQCVEIWVAFGWAKEQLGKIFIGKERDFILLVEKMKSSLLEIHLDSNVEALVNMKLLALESATRIISDQELTNINIKQIRGILKSEKLKKEISIIEKEILKDQVFMVKARKVLYEKIDKEL